MYKGNKYCVAILLILLNGSGGILRYNIVSTHKKSDLIHTTIIIR